MELNTFSCRNGRTVTIVIDEVNDYCTTVEDENGVCLGKLDFEIFEDGDCLKLKWAYLDESDLTWCRQGIGREVLLREKTSPVSL
ncbi:MAG: hypothetical protein HRU33_14305 [Rhodobacteraceae bacterium]|nr:hypothetical protein [Paracoccaceae bacterium]